MNIYSSGDYLHFFEQTQNIITSESGGYGYGNTYYQTVNREGKIHQYNPTSDTWISFTEPHRDPSALLKDNILFTSYPDYQNEPGESEPSLSLISEKKNLLTGDNQSSITDISGMYNSSLTSTKNCKFKDEEDNDVIYYLTVYGLNYLIREHNSNTALIKINDTSRYLLVSMNNNSNKDLSIDMPVSTNANITYSSDLGALTQTGQYEYSGYLSNNYNQKLATDTGTFYVVDGKLLMTVDHDKTVYAPNEDVTLNCTVRNISTESLQSIPVKLVVDGETLTDTVMNLDVGQTYSFQHTVSKPNSFSYSGSIDTFSISGKITVASPSVKMEITSPQNVGRTPFDINVTLKNDGEIPAKVNLQISDHTPVQNIDLKPSEQYMITDTFSVIQSQSFEIQMTGDVVSNKTLNVNYDELPHVAANCNPNYPAGMISIPVNITNAGSVQSNFDCTYELKKEGQNFQSLTRTYLVKNTDTIEDQINFDLEPGSYTLNVS